jgi:hypothetical protein
MLVRLNRILDHTSGRQPIPMLFNARWVVTVVAAEPHPDRGESVLLTVQRGDSWLTYEVQGMLEEVEDQLNGHPRIDEL